MAKRPYDATKEFAPFERKLEKSTGHPNKGLTKSKHPVTGKSAKSK